MNGDDTEMMEVERVGCGENDNGGNHNDTDDISAKSADRKNGLLETLPPSHILEDGRFIYLPPPNVAERSRFFERSIARHGLLEKDMKPQDRKALATEMEVKEQEEKEERQRQVKDKTVPKIHPLAVASARLQGGGLNELNRAINLATLVNTNEFFSYTNVVDPSLEADAAVASSGAGKQVLVSSTAETAGPTATGAAASAAAATAAAAAALQQNLQTEALFCLKRKLHQFEQASRQLKRHEKRLRAGVYAQRVIDQRLFQLRQKWRLVLPEHGTRARLHAARTNEVIAVDVDVYDRDRVVTTTSRSSSNTTNRRKIGLAGRMANRVPRFATIELKDDFNVHTRTKKKTMTSHDDDDDGRDVEMKDASDLEGYTTNEMNPYEGEEEDLTKFTRAEPFAVADPTLGRVMENFDPSKIPMLNFQLDIQKASTGFLQSARLEPLTISEESKSHKAASSKNNGDEDLLTSLQHSLFCATLFESMRNELDPDEEAPSLFAAGLGLSNKGLQKMAWLASESEENFVAPPSFLVGDDDGRGLASLSVIHCHEGEVKVQLNCEYTLCIKLVEASADQGLADDGYTSNGTKPNKSSGTQSPEQLHVLCRALLLHAQEVHHRHSMYLWDLEKKKREEEATKDRDGHRGHALIAKENAPEKALILQSCVSLGSKMLFEQRIRKTLSKVSKWILSTSGEELTTEWLSLSIFDLHSQFTLSFRRLVIDAVISGDNMTITSVAEGVGYRKTHFWSEQEFEMYLKMELKRAI